MNWRERIVTNPDILMGKPSVKGTRLSVELILGWLAQGWTIDELPKSYPMRMRDDVLATRAFAADMLREERHFAIHRANCPEAEDLRDGSCGKKGPDSGAVDRTRDRGARHSCRHAETGRRHRAESGP
jgi:uncharacterized protein (DUF433 family)